MIGRLLGCFIGPAEPDDPPSAPRIRPQPLYEDLLPGLPNSLVLECILPRIPWYARPPLNATSRAWSNALDALSTLDRHRARTIYGNKHTDSGLEGNLVKVQSVKGRRDAISLYDPEQELWRKLPPLPPEKYVAAWPFYPIPRPPHPEFPSTPIVAGFMSYTKPYNPIVVDYVYGKVIAAYMYDAPEDISMCGACVWALDVQGGMWKWKERHSYTKRAFSLPIITNMVVVAGKLYILRQSYWEHGKPVVYDIVSEEWRQPQDQDYARLFPDSPDRKYTYTTRLFLDPDTEKRTKYLYARSATPKVLDHDTGTWMDCDGEKGM